MEFISRQYLQLTVHMKNDPGQFEQFEGGYLQLPDDHPHLADMLEWAATDPTIEVRDSLLRCPVPDCGHPPFVGQTAKASRQRHLNQQHPEWTPPNEDDPPEPLQVKTAAGFVCSVCTPAQTFADEEALQLHTVTLHQRKPTDAEMN